METENIDIDALGRTACWIASARGLETQRPDRLIDDPWAEALAGKPGADWLATRAPESVLPMILRARYFDEFLQRIAFEGGIRQIVLVAAGMDTRAFRLPWPPQTRVFELDQPGILSAKERTLVAAQAQPTCDRRSIKTDLGGTWVQALIDGGFDAQRPSGWLVEGLLFYIPSAAGTQLLDDITALAAPGSWLGFDVINSVMLTSPLTQKWVQMQAEQGAPWLGTMDDPEAFLASRGWQASLTQAGAADANHGRWTLPILPIKMPNMPHNWFVTTQKSE